MNEVLPQPLPSCWADPSHGDATFLVDAVAICGDCAEGIARAVPLPAGWHPKAEEKP